MVRKRKMPRQGTMRRNILGFLSAIGDAANHTIMINICETPARRNKDGTEVDIMKMICYKGIPACCLSAKGSGPTEALAEEAAGHAMLDYFRSVLSNQVISEIFKNHENDPDGAQFQPILQIFKEFEIAIAADFLAIGRCSQYDITSAALLRGKEVKKRVMSLISGTNTACSSGAASLSERGKLLTTSNDDDVIVLNDDREIQPVDKTQYDFDDEITILDEVDNAFESKKTMRRSDAIQKDFVERRVAEQIENRRRLTSNGMKEVDFGTPNKSGDGPPEVFCAFPSQSREHFHFTEDASSDSDDGETFSKRRRLDNERKEGEQTDVLVHITSKKQSSAEEYANEINDIVDELDDNNGMKSNIPSKTANNLLSQQSTEIRDLPLSNPIFSHQNFYDGHPNLEVFLNTRNLPIQYQAKTIGVIYNEQLGNQVKVYVNSVTRRSIEDVALISKLTWDHYLNNSQTDAVYDVKMRARQLLFKEIQKLCSEKCISLQVTGSTVNGCGSYNSDIDMCLCYPTVGYRGQCFDDFHCERNYSAKVLRRIDRAFKRLSVGHPLKNVVRSCDLIPAKVPIIKLLLNGEFDGIDIDINVNNIAGIYNSHLVHYYSLVDARFPALSLLVKHWAMRVGVNNSPDGYLNSYTIILLVVHYLQCGVQPAVLPNLQYLFPHKFDKKLPLEELLLFGKIADKLPASPPNTWSLGELLIGFFAYFSSFDFERYAISIRSAQAFSRNRLPRDTYHSPIFVEEPFDAINTARSVRTSFHMNAIKNAFKTACNVFLKNNFSIIDLGVPVVSRQ